MRWRGGFRQGSPDAPLCVLINWYRLFPSPHCLPTHTHNSPLPHENTQNLVFFTNSWHSLLDIQAALPSNEFSWDQGVKSLNKCNYKCQRPRHNLVLYCLLLITTAFSWWGQSACDTFYPDSNGSTFDPSFIIVKGILIPHRRMICSKEKKSIFCLYFFLFVKF